MGISDEDKELAVKIQALETLFRAQLTRNKQATAAIVEEAKEITRIARSSRPDLPAVRPGELTERFAAYTGSDR